MQNEATRYNGWTNYETWLVNLWLDNDQGSQEAVTDLARECFSIEDEDHGASDLAARLEEFVAELYEVPTAGLIADLVNAALGSVDWREIATHAIDNILCTRCGGTGAVDAAMSDDDPCCPDCDGDGHTS